MDLNRTEPSLNAKKASKIFQQTTKADKWWCDWRLKCKEIAQVQTMIKNRINLTTFLVGLHCFRSSPL